MVELDVEGESAQPVNRILNRQEMMKMKSLVQDVPSAQDMRDKAIELVRATRTAETVEFGASARASMGLVRTAKARAFLEGRNYVSWEDVTAMAIPVLRHRILLDFRAERDGVTSEDVIRELVSEFS